MHTTILLSIAVSMLAIFTILLLIVLKKRKEKDSETIAKDFENMVKENKLTIHYKDVFKKKMICFDKANKKLLMLDADHNKKMKCCLELDEIYSCRIIQLKDKFENCIKILLEIVHKENAHTVTFCFYDQACDDVRERTCLLLKAQHWNQRINYHKKFWWINSNEYAL